MPQGTPKPPADTRPVCGVRLKPQGWFKLREANGLDTDAKLARQLGLPQATISRLMAGQHDPSTHFIATTMIAFPSAGFDRLFEPYRKAAA